MRIIFTACFIWIVLNSGQVKGNCNSELGMQNKRIPDENITASSELSANHAPAFARLDSDEGAWCSAPNDSFPYIQILLNEEKAITKIKTQGIYKESRWATEYQIKYLKEGKWFTYEKADGSLTFDGNFGSWSLQEIDLQPPIRTRSIRIYPKAPFSVKPNEPWTLNNVSCLRLELYGCSAPVAPQLLLSSNRLMAEEKQNVTIACNATGQPLPSITWSRAVGNLPADRTKVMNGTLTINSVTRKDGGTYICKAENILGSATDTAQLVIFSRLRFKVRPPQELTPVIGSSVHLPCVAEIDLRTTITWTKDGKSSLPVESNVLQNGSLLIQNIKKSHEGSYTCRATNALTTIQAKVKINSPVIATSCSVIRKYVSSVSRNYVIDPDGTGGLAPFAVHCDMSDKNGVGVTVISHDSENRTLVNGYGAKGSYSRDIRYTGASLSQLASLTTVSSHCEQFIKYECSHSVMLGYGVYAWWVSRDSTKMTYWGGASPGSGKCACGMTNSCADTWRACNCDKDDGVWREDSGLLTDKTHLPVKQLRFGDTSFGQQGYHTLGKFKCYGTA